MSHHAPQQMLEKLKRWYQRGRTIRVPLDRLLVGGESGIDSSRYARMVGEPLRASRSLAESPHVKLLRQYQQMSDRILEPAIFEQTAYYQNARQAIEFTGRYFDAKDAAGIHRIAGGFIEQFNTGKNARASSDGKHPIKIQPIAHSDCYEIVDGHHRLAIALVRGIRRVRARARRDAVLTPLQSAALEVLWQKGRRELYQPLDFPEFRSRWPLVRRCVDRLEMMRRFLAEEEIAAGGTYLDMGSSYGWFVAQMQKLGFGAAGVEIDPFAINVGVMAYGLNPEQLTRCDCATFLRGRTGRFDVVSCMSVLHHYVMGKGNVSAAELMGLLDKVTGRVLFMDTGQGHERWFRKELKEWDPDYIENWIRSHSSFKRIHRLGLDRDNVPPYEENYSRTLFACVR